MALGEQLDGIKGEQELFLRAYEEAGTISTACRVTLTPRSTIYYWREHDPDFAQKLEEVGLAANELLIGEARRRAYQGILRKKFEKGKPLIDEDTGLQYVEREYSDTLMMFLIKAKNPEYRDRQQLDLHMSGSLLTGPLSAGLTREEIEAELSQLEAKR